MPLRPSRLETRLQIVGALLAVACYVGALANGFAWDDTFIVYGDRLIHSWAGIPSALHLGYWHDAGHLYRPLTTVSFAVDWIISGGAPALFHAVNIAWHALAAVLVARLALRWWSPAAAAMAVGIFAVQPVHVEAVANIVGRSELMCSVALIALALVATRPLPPPATAESRYQVLLIGVLAAVAAASKETGIVAPVVAWAGAWLTAKHATPGSRDAGRRATIRMTAAACAGVTFELAVRLYALGGFGGDRPHPAFRASTVWQGTALALASIPRAVSLVVVPQLPRPDYSPTEAALVHPNAVLVVLGILLVAGAIVGVFAHARAPSPWTLALVFAAATFAPASNLLVRVGIVIAERTLYSPSVGAALLEGAALAVLARTRPRLAFGAVVAVLFVSTALTLRAIPIWRDTPSVFAAMRERSPTSYRGYALSATESDAAGDHATARRYYLRAIGLFSRAPNVLRAASENALLVGDTASALEWLDKAVRTEPAEVPARTALAALLIGRGDTARAGPLLRDGLRMFPAQEGWRQMLATLGADGRRIWIRAPRHGTAPGHSAVAGHISAAAPPAPRH